MRIDILERLFIHIIENNLKFDKEIKLVPEMLNLLGCSKDNFLKLLNSMNYKIYKKDKEIFFKYKPKKRVIKKRDNANKFDNPFTVLNKLNLE